ncbi:MAG: hypothetical protein IKV85_01830 [Ruminococcus sp.]|nr:hypothetical protein [Ruminococcus sp.]
MKKTLLFLTVLITLCTVVSCNSDKPAESSLPMNEAVYNEEGKPVITVGTMGYIDPLFNDHLNKPKDFDIKVVDYSKGIEYTTEKEYTEAINNELNMAMLTGESPDIICHNATGMMNLDRKGLLADLYSFMDGDSRLKREDFLPCVLEGLEIEGRLPAVMEAYTLYTAVAKTKFIPKEYEHWTSADAMKFYEEYKDKMDFCKYTSESSLAEYMLKIEGLCSIDLRNSVCDFGTAFRDSLQFCLDTPIQAQPEPNFALMDDYDRTAYFKDEETRGLNDTQLVFPLSINGFNCSLGQDTYGFFNKEDITFVGYPYENGSGAYVHSTNLVLYGITEQCSSKEAAWELITLILKQQKKLEKFESTNIRGIPVLKEQLQRDYDRPSDYNSSINNGFMWNIWNNCGEDVFMPQEYKDMLYEYILSVPANPYFYNSELQNIIDEEVGYAINGDRNADDTAYILNDRIGTYLSEKS